MAKRSAETIHAAKVALAEQFMEIVLPRVMEQYSTNLDTLLEHLRAVKMLGVKDEDTIAAGKLLEENEVKMARLLSGETTEKMREFYVNSLVDSASEEELKLAVLQEGFTVKFNGITALSEAVLMEAIRED